MLGSTNSQRRWCYCATAASAGTSSNATRLMILISGLTAGPAVSLYGIADGVAGHRRLVGVGTLAAVVAVFDVLLGVVPGAAAGGHRDRDEETGDDGADQHAAERLGAGLASIRKVKPKATITGTNSGSSEGTTISLIAAWVSMSTALVVFRLGGAFHDAFDLAELAAHFFHHRAGRAAHRFHRHRGEEEGDHAADQETDQDQRVGKVEHEVLAGRNTRPACACSRRTAPAPPGRPSRSRSPWSPPWWCCPPRPAGR